MARRSPVRCNQHEARWLCNRENSSAPRKCGRGGRGVLGIIRDVTERRRIEDALRVSEERLRSIVQSTKDAIVLVNALMKVAFWNKGAEATFGYWPRKLSTTGHDDHSGTVPRGTGTQRPAGACAGARAIGRARRWNSWAAGKGDEFPLELSVTSWKENPICFSPSLCAISANGGRRRSSWIACIITIRFVLNSAGEGIYGVDREGRLTFVNPAAAKMLGGKQGDDRPVVIRLGVSSDLANDRSGK